MKTEMTMTMMVMMILMIMSGKKVKENTVYAVQC